MGDYNEGLRQRKEAKEEAERAAEQQRQWIENQKQMAAIQETMEEGLAKIQSMSEEEKQALDLYSRMQGRMTYSGEPGLYQGAMDDALEVLSGYDLDEINRLAEVMQWADSKERMEEIAQAGQDKGNGDLDEQILGSTESIFGNVAGTVMQPLGYLGEYVNRTGQFPTMNPNNMGNALNVYGSEIRSAVAEDIIGDGSSKTKKALAYLYQGGMSFLDNMARLAASGGSGGVSLGLAGLGSFGQTMQEASERGATPGQAMAMATAAGILEVATEKMSLDEWFNVAKDAPADLGTFLKNALKQGGVEVTEEEISFAAMLLVDAAVMGEQSEYAQSIMQKMAQDPNLSYEKARDTAQHELWNEALDTAITSFISGGLSAGSSWAVSKANGTQGTQQNAQQDIDTLQTGQVIAGDVQSMTDDALGVRQDAAPEAMRAQPEVAPGKPEVASPQQAEVNQDMFGQTAEALYQPRAEAPVQQTAEDVSWAADRVAGVQEEAPGASEAANPILTSETQDTIALDEAMHSSGADNSEATTGASTDIVTRQMNHVNEKNSEMNADNEMGIKEQIRSNQEMLNSMDTVASIQTPQSFKQMDKTQKMNWVIEKLRPTNYQVDREGFGIIRFAKKQLKSAFNYFSKGDIEESVFEAIPYVLKNGTEISSHPDHKGRNYGTVTIAAPIEIDGKRGNMAVVVKKTPENLYKVHRILTPDGHVFNMTSETQNEAVATTTGESPKTGSLATSKATASTDSISQAGENVNIEEAKKEFGASASVADSLGLPGAKSTPNSETDASVSVADGLGQSGANNTPSSSISVSDLMGLVKGDAEKYVPKPAGKTNEARSTTTGVPTATAEGLASSIDHASTDSVPQAGENVNGNLEKETLSAAKEGFSGKQDYYDLLTDENAQRDRPGDVRPVEVPKTDGSGKTVSEFVGNAYGSDLTSDAMANRIEELVRDNVLGFDRQSNQKTLLGARDYIFGSEETGKGKGVAATRAEVTRAAERGKIGTDDIAKAIILYEEYNSKKGATALDNATEVFLDLQQMASRSGRNLQLFKLFRQMSPEGKFQTVEKEVQRTLEYGKKHGKITKDTKVVIPPELESAYKESARVYMNAKSDQSKADAELKMNEAQNAIYEAAAAQMKSTAKAQWDAWRYMCMLGNPKTQVRNFAGNAAFIPYVEAKRAIGAGIERMTLSKDQRTKSVLNPLNEGDNALIAWAKSDAKSGDVSNALEGSAKLGDTKKNTIEDNVRIFDNDVMEKLREITDYFPSAGDMIFKNREYSRSLASFMKSRGYSAADIQNGTVSEAVLNEGRNYAINEAMRATFNDSNAFSDFLSSRYQGDNPVGKAANYLAEGVMPFRKTPANIVVRSIENSPVGLVKGVWNAAVNVKNGKVTAATAIDQIAAGITGTAAMALGFALANGIGGVRLTGGGMDDDDRRQGHQDYALEFSRDGKLYSYTIDWAAPANLPLFVGAEIQNILAANGADTNLSKFTSALYSIRNLTEPMLNLSCLSSLNELVESAKYAEDGTAMYALAATAATSYFTQGIPSLLRQTEKVLQPNKQSTFANSSDPLIRDMEREAAGIPFVGNVFKTDTRDAWGETVSNGSIGRRIFDAYFNPGTLKVTENSALEDEINRLNDSQPESVSPPSTPKTITYTDTDGEAHKNYRLTEEEYQTLAEVQGQTAKTILDGIRESDAYQALSDKEKAKVFDYVYDYAREKGRAAALDGYEMADSWMHDVTEGEEQSSILTKVTGSVFDDAFKSLTSDWEYERDASDSVAELERAYDVFDAMGEEAKDAFRESAGGRVEYFLTAKENGVNTETFVDLYGRYRDIDKDENLDTGEKANAWATALAKARKAGDISRSAEAAMKEAMAFRYSMVAETEHLDSLNKMGLSPDTAKMIVDTMDRISETASRTDKYRTIAAMTGKNGLTTYDIDDVMKEWMPDYDPAAKSPDKTELKYDYARKELGLSPQEFVDAYEVNSQYSKKKDREDAWKEMGLSEKTAEALYKLFGGRDTEFNKKLVELYGG